MDRNRLAADGKLHWHSLSSCVYDVGIGLQTNALVDVNARLAAFQTALASYWMAVASDGGEPECVRYIVAAGNVTTVSWALRRPAEHHMAEFTRTIVGSLGAQHIVRHSIMPSFAA